MTVETEPRTRAPSSTKAPLLRMQGIVKSFPGVKALRGVSLELQAGHVMAIVGENGAGKSSLVKTLSGAYEPDEGDIEIDGKPLARGTNAAIDAGVAVIYQELSLINDMTVAENLFLGRMPASKGFVKQREAHAMARRRSRAWGSTTWRRGCASAISRSTSGNSWKSPRLSHATRAFS